MKTLGIRVAPKLITFAVYDSDSEDMANVEVVKIPAAMNIPQGLKYARNAIIDILALYKIDRAGIKTTEPIARKISVERVQLEGVIQEAFASSNIESYTAGPVATVASLLKVKPQVFKQYVDGTETPAWATGWERLNKEKREAVLLAVGVSNAN